MSKLITRIKRLALALCFVTPLVSWAATYSTYKDDATTFRTGAYGNANYQRFKINADWMFNTDDNDIAATADAVQLDSIKVYWHSGGHNNADIGKASGNEVDPYLVVTTPQGVIVGISAAGAKWTASGSSTFEFTDLVISPNAQYYYYFATDVSSLTVGGAMSGAKQARFTGAWHGANSSSVTSDTTVCVMDDGRYSIRCDFEVSAATATTITTTSEGVSLSTGSDPVVVKGAVADGVVTVASGATVPALTVVGEATTLKLTDSLTATYLYLPATTTIDASDVTFTMPGSDETEATTTLVNGKISAASNPSVTLPTPAEGYAFESPAYTDAGIAVTITKFADASLDIGSSTVNWSEVRPEGWVNSPVPKITVAYTDGGKIVFDEDVQAASITPDGTGSLVLERAADVTVSIAAVAIDQNAAAMDITFKNFTAIPTYSPYYTAGSDIVRADGTETLTSHPLIHTDNAAGKFYFTQPVTMDAFTLYGNKTVYFNAGTTGSFGRFVLGNTGNKTQTVTQNDGTITVTGNAAPSSNQASILLGHYSGNVTLNTVGGTFNALNAISRLGWDGTATWAIGGGTSAATVNALGIQNGGNGHSGTGTLNIFQNGTLNLGSGGIDFQNGSNGGAINLAGGTIAASADLTIANSKAAGTILNQGKTTTINTDSNTVTLSAPLSGTGALTKTGSGVLKVTGAGTATGGVTVSGGTLRFEGSGAKIGTGNINLTGEGAKLELVPGEGNTITLAPQFLINSTGQNSTPVVEVGAGTVVIADTGTAANGHFAYSTINILNGGDMQLTKGDLLGYNFTFPINIAAGGKLTISKRETFTRNLNLNGGSVYLVKNDADGRALDLYNGRGTITVTADSSIDSETDAATIWVRKQAANVTVNSGATLTLNAIVETTDPYADTNGGITKSGDGTLKLTKANTSTGTLAVNAGVLELDGGSWAGPVALAAGTTLNVVTESEIGPGGTIATFGSGSTFGEGVVVQINGVTVDDAAIDANGVVTRVVPVTYVAITVPTVENASVVVSDGTTTYTSTTEGGTKYSVPAGATITVTYTAAEGYGLEGTSSYTLTNVAEGDAVTITDTEAKPYVASIVDGASYTSLQAAFDAATNGKKIVLLANEEAGVTLPSEEKMVYFYAGELTHGEIANATGNYITTVTENEVIKIGSENVTATKYRVQAGWAVVTIGGTATMYAMADYAIAFEAANAGGVGTTVKFLDGQGASYAEYLPAFTYDSVNDIYVLEETPVAAVYSGVSQLGTYTSIDDAIAAVDTDGLTVKLLADVDVVSTGLTFPADKTITFDLNGYTLTAGNGATSHVQVNGVVTITDSSEGAEGQIVSGENGTYGLVQVAENNTQEGAALTIAGGTIEAYFPDTLNGSQQHPAYGVTVKGKGTVFNMTGGKVKAGLMAVMGHGNKASAGTYTISGGTIESVDDFAMYLPTKGGCSVTISGGTFVGKGGICVRAGTLNVTGGTFTASGTGIAPGASAGTTGASFAGLSVWPNYGVIDVTISGGAFTSATGVDAVVSTESDYTASISLTGGAYSTDPSAYVAFGYKATETAGIWTVAQQPTTPPETPQVIDVDTTKEPEQQQADADAIAQDTVVTTPNADVAAAVSAETYDSYFTKTAVKVNEQWTVQTALNEDVVFPTSESDDLTADLADVLDVAAGADVEITTAKPGLYYSIEAAENVGFTSGKVEGVRELATTATVSPKKPAKTGTAVFYRVKVSVKQND